MYARLGIVLVLSSFVLANLLAALVSLAAWRLFGDRLSARGLFLLRVLPGLAGLFFAFVLAAPAYLALEPRSTHAPVGFVLGGLAIVGAALLVRAAGRGLGSWLSTRRLESEWLASAEPARVAAWRTPVFRIRHSFPVMALVGLWRPRAFVSSQVLDALSPSEVEAVLAHEAGHLEAHDNLRSLSLQSSPDLLSLLPAGREIESAWARAAEQEADARAATPLDLASALLKVARLVPAGGMPPSLPVSALHGEHGVTDRIARLAGGASQPRPGRADTGLLMVALTVVPLALAVAAAADGLQRVHALAEVLIHSLP